MVTRVPLQDLRIVVTAILIQKESGGNLAEVLDKAAQVIRERFRLEAADSGSHRTGTPDRDDSLAFCRSFSGIALYLVNPSTMSLLWTRDIGIKLLYAAAGMTVIGGLIIRKIVNMEV